MSYGPGWSVATPTRLSEKPRPSGRGGVTTTIYDPDGNHLVGLELVGQLTGDDSRVDTYVLFSITASQAVTLATALVDQADHIIGLAG